jgi:hypothetical protein
MSVSSEQKQSEPSVLADAELSQRESILPVVWFGIIGVLTLGWVGLLGWGAVRLFSLF